MCYTTKHFDSREARSEYVARLLPEQRERGHLSRDEDGYAVTHPDREEVTAR